MFDLMRRVLPAALMLLGGPIVAAEPLGGAEHPPGCAGMAYRLERPGLDYRDVLTRTDGRRLIGRVLEWGLDVCLFDSVGRAEVIPVGDVRAIALRRDGRLSARPTAADLTVEYVSQWAGGGAGADESGPSGKRLSIHVRNAGLAPAGPFSYRVSVDGNAIHEGRTSQALAAGQVATIGVDCDVASVRGKLLLVELDVKNELSEAAEWNNRFTDVLGGLPVRVVVPADRHRAISNARNLVDTFCFEDWIQYHAQLFNRIIEQSVYPSLPHGSTARIHIEQITIAPTPEADSLAASAPASQPAAVASIAPASGSSSQPAEPQVAEQEQPVGVPKIGMIEFERLPAGGAAAGSIGLVDWGVERALGRALGLIDPTALDTPVTSVLVRGSNSEFVQREFFPPERTLLSAGGAAPLSELEVRYLERIFRRQLGVPGEYLYGLPRICGLRVVDGSGRDLPGVDVAVFQRRVSADGAVVIPEEPVYIGETDTRGRFALPPRDAKGAPTPNGYALAPNPWGELAADGSNGLFLVRLRKDANEEYGFVSVLDFNLAYARGSVDAYDHLIPTRLAGGGGPPAPRYCRTKPDFESPETHVQVIWPTSASATAWEYRVYAKIGFDEPHWALVETVPKEKATARGVFSLSVPLAPYERRPSPRAGDPLGCQFAVSCVDRDGREGPLSMVTTEPYSAEAMKLAILRGTAYFSLAGPLRRGLVKTNINSIHDVYGLRFTQFPGYEPWGGGMAFDAQDRLLMTDPYHHQLCWYENGVLVRVLGDPRHSPDAYGRGKEQFHTPMDVTIDDRGRIYVADTDNDRVQVFDAQGTFLTTFQDDTGDTELFRKPTAIGFAYGKVCVTDSDGTRIQVFEPSDEAWKLRRVLKGVRDADRALAGASGRIYALGRNTLGNWAILIYPIEPMPEGDVPERTIERVIKGMVREPRGLYPDGTGHALYITGYPFVTQRLMLE